jgi:hypothetical protein
VVPWLGYVLATMRTPAGWFGLVILPAVLLLSVVLVGLWSPAEERSRGISPGPT